jgi:predicted porin
VRKQFAMLCTLAVCSATVQADTNVTIYGNLDQYLGYIKSNGTGGHSITGLNDGSILRSRLGLRGIEELGGSYQAKFNLETGFNTDSGTFADPSRVFDRQAWVGMNTAAGEFRAGRQNTEIFFIGGAIDYTERSTFGSIINTFGVPSRYDNDLSFKSPRIANLQAAVHYALTEVPGESINQRSIIQLALDYTNGPYRAGYAGLAAKPAPDGPFQNKVQYHNLYADYDYGKGKVYLAYVRSNNVTGNAAGNNATGILSNVSIPDNYFPGTSPDIRRFYNIYQISADYRISPKLRVGALWGTMIDRPNTDSGARGGNVGAYYELSKQTTLYGFANHMKNERNAGFRFSGSAGPSANLTGSDINGRTLFGLQAGILHRF